METRLHFLYVYRESAFSIYIEKSPRMLQIHLYFNNEKVDRNRSVDIDSRLKITIYWCAITKYSLLMIQVYIMVNIILTEFTSTLRNWITFFCWLRLNFIAGYFMENILMSKYYFHCLPEQSTNAQFYWNIVIMISEPSCIKTWNPNKVKWKSSPYQIKNIRVWNLFVWILISGKWPLYYINKKKTATKNDFRS